MKNKSYLTTKGSVICILIISMYYPIYISLVTEILQEVHAERKVSGGGRGVSVQGSLCLGGPLSGGGSMLTLSVRYYFS